MKLLTLAELDVIQAALEERSERLASSEPDDIAIGDFSDTLDDAERLIAAYRELCSLTLPPSERKPPAGA